MEWRIAPKSRLWPPSCLDISRLSGFWTKEPDAGGKLRFVAPGQLTPERLASQLQQLFGITL